MTKDEHIAKLQKEVSRLERERQYYYDRWFMNERALQAEIEECKKCRRLLAGQKEPSGSPEPANAK